MRLAVMQPYFFPYIGYFQLITAADLFIVYDNIKYTKKGWINRNRILQSGKGMTFSLPLKSASDCLDICQRELAADFRRDKLLNQFKGAYEHAPYFAQTFPVIEQIICHKESNLFRFLYHSLVSICKHLGITTQMQISSSIEIDHALRNKDKVLALCGALAAETYVNAIGGTALYSREPFAAAGIDLKFLSSRSFAYKQFGASFIPCLSIIDVLMFNDQEKIQTLILPDFELVDGQPQGKA
ncbi:MAG: WbqC family protein [Candidatus Accumulibacter sp. UW20]|jgi:hypothetical protein